MHRESRWQMFVRRLAAAFVPEVRLQVWPVGSDLRSQAERDRDIESTWRARVRLNERRRELARREAAQMPVEASPVPHTRLLCRQAD